MENLTEKIVSFEQGELPEKEVIELFGKLIETGMAWQLQGTYGRIARTLMEIGIISKDGKVDMERYNLL